MSTSGVTFSGLGTGIDTAAIVDALMRIERLPIDRIEHDKAKVKERQGVVQEINKLLSALQTKAAALFAPGALAAKTATSADARVVTASADSSAAAGTYNVEVTSLATSHTLASTTAPTLTAGQTLEITVGGTAASVTVQEGDTLQALADRVNATTGMGAAASVINDRLVLVSRTSGSGGTVSVAGTAADALGFTTTQAGQDAQVTVNGLQVTSSGNTVKGAVSGLTLTLAGTGATTVTVGADTARAQKDVQDFVDAYNALIGNVNNATRYDAGTKTAGTLQGDQTFTSLAGAVRGIAGAAVSGLGGAYDSLAQIGIAAARDGQLTLDAARFQEALAADPNAVRSVFAHDDGDGALGASDGIARRLSDLASTFSKETIPSRLTGYTTSLQRMDDKIKGLESLMDLKEQRLRQQFAAMEKAVYQFQSQGADLAARLSSLF